MVPLAEGTIALGLVAGSGTVTLDLMLLEAVQLEVGLAWDFPFFSIASRAFPAYVPSQ